jgi:hypothetical protein
LQQCIAINDDGNELIKKLLQYTPMLLMLSISIFNYEIEITVAVYQIPESAS